MNMHEPATDQQSTDSEPTPARPFRLGIAHLLLWTACSAVLMTSFRTDPFTIEEPFLALGIMTNNVIYSISYGAALASLAVFFSRGMTGVRFPGTGGQWVLLCYGWVALGMVVMGVIYQVMCWAHGVERLAESQSSFYWFLRALLAYAVALIFARLILLELPTRWKSFAMLTATVSMLHGCMFAMRCVNFHLGWLLFLNLATFFIVLKLIPLAFCLGRDRLETVRYDLLHRAGWVVGATTVAMECYGRLLRWAIM